jgi:3-deoxy-D-manno-octulosonic-acid transferase
MSRSLSLAAVLALRRGVTSTPTVASVPRPAGPLIWLQFPGMDRIEAVQSLAQHLTGQGTVLATAPDLSADDQPGLLLRPTPSDQTAPVRAFLDHWRPDLLVWLTGHLRPVLLTETDRPAIPRILMDAEAGALTTTGAGWLPGVTRALAGRFDHVLAADQDAAIRARKAGVAESRIEVTGRLDPIPAVLPCNERERRDLAQSLGTRPLWLAAEVPVPEVAGLIQAYRQARRRAHRLLLILMPRDPIDRVALQALLRADGLNVSVRSDGGEPEDGTDVYLADPGDEMGLWYRLAPLTYLGGSLSDGRTRHPFEAAALGSVVLHGPATALHEAAFHRLQRAGATRLVRNGADLGQAIEVLLSPDRAAAMAHAAWDVTTAGAEVGNRAVELIRAALAARNLAKA